MKKRTTRQFFAPEFLVIFFWSDKSTNLQPDIGKSTKAACDADMEVADVCLFWGKVTNLRIATLLLTIDLGEKISFILTLSPT